MSTDNPKTRAGSLSSQCLQALREEDQTDDRLSPLVPNGLNEMEESLRERAWLQSFVKWTARGI